MNVLILTGKFGMGHYSAAEAIRQQIIESESEPDACVTVVDIIDYMFPVLNKVIYGGFNFMVSKCSFVYNVLNELAATGSEVPLEKTVVKRIEFLLEEHQADLVVATLPVCAQYISAYKKTTGNTISLYTYVTDITVHDEWIAEKTDLYFVGAMSTKDGLVSKNIDGKKIIVCGIPVKQCFKTVWAEREKQEKKEILIMGGGLGLIPSSDLLLTALCNSEHLHITVIAGKNEALEEKLRVKFPNASVIGYTDHVDRYLRNADLVITKSGGITTFEAIHTETPLYIVKPFLSQEVGNARFIERCHIGRVVWSKSTDVVSDVLTLLQCDEELELMKRNMAELKDGLDAVSLLEIFYERGEALCG